VLVLERNGCRPVFPKQGCCGVPPLFYADLKAFRRQAQANANSLAREGCDVVTACTSCALAIKHDYPRWLETEEAKAVAARTSDVMEYLVRLKSENRLDTAFQRVDLRLSYHAPCHVKALGIDLIESRLALLNSVPGISVTWTDRGCCGLSGTFGMKRVNYEMSMTIGQPLFEEIEQSAPDAVITECPACAMQITQCTGVTVLHPVRIVEAAYELVSVEALLSRECAKSGHPHSWPQATPDQG
jgi:glycerol-3-phosphate dehydrogenase subunit C